MSLASELLRSGLLTVAPVTSSQESTQIDFDAPLKDPVIKVPSVFNPSLVAFSRDQQPIVETFRILSTRIHHLRTKSQKRLRKLLVTSAVPQEGKTFVAANLAASLSAGNQQVLLLDGDFRRPALNRLFNLNGRAGLSDAVKSDFNSPSASNFCKCMYQVDSHSVWLMPTGSIEKHPIDVLQSRRMEQLMNVFSASFDWVVVDAPPVLPFADVETWTRLCDGVLLVVRQGTTPKSDLQQALVDLNEAPLLGVIYNDSKQRQSRYYEYYQKAATEKPRA